MTPAKAAGKVSMPPRMIKMKVDVIASIVVTHPFAVAVDVRRFGMTFPIAEGCLRRRLVRSARMGRRSVVGNVAATKVVTAAVSAMLRECGQSKDH